MPVAESLKNKPWTMTDHGVPRTGSLWSDLYLASAKALENERLCLGNLQTSDKTGKCAVGALALNLNPIDTVMELIPYDIDPDNGFVFALNEQNVEESIKTYIKNNFSAKQIKQALPTTGPWRYNTPLDAIYQTLIDFIILVNDTFKPLEGENPYSMDYHHPARKQAEYARAEHVRNVLRAAAQWAKDNE